MPTTPIDGAAEEEHAQDRAAGGAHGAHDGDVAALALHQHGDAGDDVEGGDQDDQGQDQEHHVALDLERGEEMASWAAASRPAGRRSPMRAAGRAGRRRPGRGRATMISIAFTRSRQLEVGLRVGERHEDEAVVVLVHADLEHRADGEGLDPRHDAQRGRRTLGRDQGELAAEPEAHPLRHAAADGRRARDCSAMPASRRCTWLAMTSRAARSAGRTPRTSAPEATPLALAITWPST